jgi:hypothetical protein
MVCLLLLTIAHSPGVSPVSPSHAYPFIYTEKGRRANFIIFSISHHHPAFNKTFKTIIINIIRSPLFQFPLFPPGLTKPCIMHPLSNFLSAFPVILVLHTKYKSEPNHEKLNSNFNALYSLSLVHSNKHAFILLAATPNPNK